MSHFRVSVKARQDLTDIGMYTEQNWGRVQRTNYLHRLKIAFQQLAINPSLGISCDHVCLGYLRYPVARHVVFYRLGKDNVPVVIRVLHHSMDVKTALKN